MRFFIVFVGLPLSIAAGVLAWQIGENITPGVLSDLIMVFGMLGGAAVGLTVLFVTLRFASTDRANERNHTTARQRKIEAQPPVVIFSNAKYVPAIEGGTEPTPAGYFNYQDGRERFEVDK